MGGFPHPAVDLRLVQPHIMGTEGNIFINSLLEKLVFRILKHQPHLKAGGPGGGLVRPDVFAPEQNLAGGGLEQPVQMLDKSGLSGTGPADDCQIFPFISGEIHRPEGAVLKGRAGAVYMGELLGFQNCFQMVSVLT